MTTEWECCTCPKYKASKHEELCLFSKYDPNPKKREEGSRDTTYCEECFNKKSRELE